MTDAAALRHLEVLRELLQRDYLSRPDWGYALRDLARMVRQALGASGSLVALHDEAAQSWLAITEDGERLDDEAISERASRSVLEQVRITGQPVLSTGDEPLELSSESLRMHEVESVLAVPLHWWDGPADPPQRRFAGCLYAQRTWRDEPFAASDVDLMLDLARIAQPALNVLRHLRELQADLELSRRQLEGLRHASALRYRLGEYETHDAAFAETVLGTLRSVAHADKVGLLLLGPTGSGKSYLAEAYHYECPRKAGPFVVLDCSQATSETTLAAELFGYAPRSGFANAPPQGRPGAAELAHGGTLFLDEIGTMPRELQQRLLALIQTGTFSPLGSGEKKRADLQVLAATNEDLHELVQKKQFREDLFWRIGMVTIRLPALSERRADIPHLAHGFLRAACKQFGRRDLSGGFAAGALAALEAFDWSRAGNIRGLEQTVYRSVLLAAPGTRQLDAEHVRLQSLDAAASAAVAAPPAKRPRRPRGPVPAADRPIGPSATAAAEAAAVAGPAGDSGSLEAIQAAIRQHRYSTAAAEALGISHGSLVWTLRKAGLTIRDVLAR